MKTNKIAKALGDEYKVKLTGAAILWLTNMIKEKQIAVDASLEIATVMEMEDQVIERLQKSSEACTQMGCLFFDAIEQVFGKKWLDQYIEGEVEIPVPPPPQGVTIN
jgi:hypothetical protein